MRNKLFRGGKELYCLQARKPVVVSPKRRRYELHATGSIGCALPGCEQPVASVLVFRTHRVCCGDVEEVLASAIAGLQVYVLLSLSHAMVRRQLNRIFFIDRVLATLSSLDFTPLERPAIFSVS